MEYIELSEGTSIRTEEIEAIIANPDGLTCTVRTCMNIYQSTFPYDVLIGLLQKNQEEPEKKEALNIFKTLGSFAG